MYALPMGGFKFSVCASIYNIPCPIPCTFEKDQVLHMCVTSQGNFCSPSPHRNIVIWQPRVISPLFARGYGRYPPITHVAHVIANFNWNIGIFFLIGSRYVTL